MSCQYDNTFRFFSPQFPNWNQIITRGIPFLKHNTGLFSWGSTLLRLENPLKSLPSFWNPCRTWYKVENHFGDQHGVSSMCLFWGCLNLNLLIPSLLQTCQMRWWWPESDSWYMPEAGRVMEKQHFSALTPITRGPQILSRTTEFDAISKLYSQMFRERVHFHCTFGNHSRVRKSRESA